MHGQKATGWGKQFTAGAPHLQDADGLCMVRAWAPALHRGVSRWGGEIQQCRSEVHAHGQHRAIRVPVSSINPPQIIPRAAKLT